MANPYLDLTDEFNRERLRVLLSSGQAVVVHRLAVMSKDGDWIVREEQEALDHVLRILASHGARYRFGAPLDLRWLRGGWSSHFEFSAEALRVRCDFVSRPPRITGDQLAGMWHLAASSGQAVVQPVPLAAIKLTNREKDYAVVGELARLMRDPADRLRFSRSARDLLELATANPQLLAVVSKVRPSLAAAARGREALEEALDRERRELMRANEVRLSCYQDAAAAWAESWKRLQREIDREPLLQAHRRMCERADGVLPFEPAGAMP